MRWDDECEMTHGRVLRGKFKHWCHSEWDGMPIDETCKEFEVCHCEWADPQMQAEKERTRGAMSHDAQ